MCAGASGGLSGDVGKEMLCPNSLEVLGSVVGANGHFSGDESEEMLSDKNSLEFLGSSVTGASVCAFAGVSEALRNVALQGSAVAGASGGCAGDECEEMRCDKTSIEF